MSRGPDANPGRCRTAPPGRAMRAVAVLLAGLIVASVPISCVCDAMQAGGHRSLAAALDTPAGATGMAPGHAHHHHHAGHAAHDGAGPGPARPSAPGDPDRAVAGAAPAGPWATAAHGHVELALTALKALAVVGVARVGAVTRSRRLRFIAAGRLTGRTIAPRVPPPRPATAR